MDGARVGKLGMDLIGDHRDAMLERERRDGRERVGRGGDAGGVVRAAEQVRGDLGLREGRGESFEIEFVSIVGVSKERDVDDHAPADVADGAEEGRVDGCVHDHALARCSQRPNGLGHRREDIREDDDMGRIDHPPPGRQRVLGQGLRQLTEEPIADIGAIDRRMQSRGDRCGERVVHLSQPCRDDVRVVDAPFGARALPERVERDLADVELTHETNSSRE